MLDLGIDLNLWPWIWLGIAVFFALIELTVLAGSFVLLPFAVSALAAAILLTLVLGPISTTHADTVIEDCGGWLVSISTLTLPSINSVPLPSVSVRFETIIATDNTTSPLSRFPEIESITNSKLPSAVSPAPLSQLSKDGVRAVREVAVH